MKKNLILFFTLLFCINALFAATYKAGTDYTVLSPSVIAKLKVAPAPRGKVKVVEFFNYGCPACAFAEPAVEKWLKTKPAYIDFNRMPVAFEQGWDTYAKAYYVAKALNIEAKITPALFEAIHGKNDHQFHDLSSQQAIVDFFIHQGVSRSVANNAFSGASAASLDMKIKQNLTLMTQYQVTGTPTFVIADKYTVSLSQAKTPQRFMQIVNYLANLAHGK